MKFDDMTWHSGERLPADVPQRAGSTHIAIFWAWLLLNGRASDEFRAELAPQIQALRDQSMSPGEDFEFAADGQLDSDDLDADGAAFTAYYYETYLDAYTEALGLDEFDNYRVPDTWDTYNRIAPIINRAYGKWIGDGRPNNAAKGKADARPHRVGGGNRQRRVGALTATLLCLAVVMIGFTVVLLIVG